MRARAATFVAGRIINPVRQIMLTHPPPVPWRAQWNHNPSRIEPLVQTLTENFHVQLEHDEKETTSRDYYIDHGWVRILYKGTQLAYCSDYQHNKNFRNRYDLNDDLVDEVDAKIAPLLKPAGPPSFIESDFTTKVEYEKWLKAKWPDYLKSKGAGAA